MDLYFLQATFKSSGVARPATAKEVRDAIALLAGEDAARSVEIDDEATGLYLAPLPPRAEAELLDHGFVERTVECGTGRVRLEAEMP